MPTVRELTDWLDERFPASLAESWDNTGLLLGDPAAEAGPVLTCLTLTEDVAGEAAGTGAGLVVSHHPSLFKGAKALTAETAEGRTLATLVKAGVAVYSPHTRFDSAAEGINAALAEAVGVADAKPLRPDETGGAGGGRFGDLGGPVPVEAFAARVAEACGAAGLHVVDAAREAVTRAAVACGAAGEFLADAAEKGCDALVLGEARFHTALEARERGVALFVPGHYGTERPAVERLAGEIAEAFDGLDCSASRAERDPLRWLGVD